MASIHNIRTSSSAIVSNIAGNKVKPVLVAKGFNPSRCRGLAPPQPPPTVTRVGPGATQIISAVLDGVQTLTNKTLVTPIVTGYLTVSGPVTCGAIHQSTVAGVNVPRAQHAASALPFRDTRKQMISINTRLAETNRRISRDLPRDTSSQIISMNTRVAETSRRLTHAHTLPRQTTRQLIGLNNRTAVLETGQLVNDIAFGGDAYGAGYFQVTPAEPGVSGPMIDISTVDTSTNTAVTTSIIHMGADGVTIAPILTTDELVVGGVEFGLKMYQIDTQLQSLFAATAASGISDLLSLAAAAGTGVAGLLPKLLGYEALADFAVDAAFDCGLDATSMSYKMCNGLATLEPAGSFMNAASIAIDRAAPMFSVAGGFQTTGAASIGSELTPLLSAARGLASTTLVYDMDTGTGVPTGGTRDLIVTDETNPVVLTLPSSTHYYDGSFVTQGAVQCASIAAGLVNGQHYMRRPHMFGTRAKYSQLATAANRRYAPLIAFRPTTRALKAQGRYKQRIALQMARLPPVRRMIAAARRTTNLPLTYVRPTTRMLKAQGRYKQRAILPLVRPDKRTVSTSNRQNYALLAMRPTTRMLKAQGRFKQRMALPLVRLPPSTRMYAASRRQNYPLIAFRTKARSSGSVIQSTSVQQPRAHALPSTIAGKVKKWVVSTLGTAAIPVRATEMAAQNLYMNPTAQLQSGIGWLSSAAGFYSYYLARSGAGGVSWTGGTAASGAGALSGINSWAHRFRVRALDTQGLLVENENEVGLFAVNGLSGNMGVLGSVSAASAAFTGAVTAASATLTGALSAASATLTGALSAASATLTGALSAASGTISGALTAAILNAPTIRANSSSVEGNYNGLQLWAGVNSLWGIYVARNGTSRSWTGGTATDLFGCASHALRVKVGGNTNAFSMVVEDSDDVALAQIRAASGNMMVKGRLTSYNNLIDMEILTATTMGEYQPLNRSVETIAYLGVGSSIFTARSNYVHIKARGRAFISGGAGNDGAACVMVLGAGGNFYLPEEGADAGEHYAERDTYASKLSWDGTFAVTPGSNYSIYIRIRYISDDPLWIEARCFSLFHMQRLTYA